MTSVNQSRVFTVFFDSESGLLLGKGGRWVTPADFVTDAPKNPEDVLGERRVPAPQSSPKPGDPSGTVRCIDGVQHFCVGDVCSPVPGAAPCS